MTLIKVQHDKNNPFLTVNRTIADDKRISFRSIGIWFYAFSRKEDWQFYLQDLVNRHKEGRDAVSTALKELEDAGYLCRHRIKDEKTGKFSGWEWIFFETSKTQEEIKEILPTHWKTDRRENRSTGNQPLTNKEPKTNKKNNKQPSADVAVFPCLNESWITKKFAQEIMAMGHEEAYIAQKVQITKKHASKNPGGFLRDAIAEDYQASKTAEEIFNENKALAINIHKNIKKRPTQGNFDICPDYVIFYFVSSSQTVGYGETDFANKLKYLMDRWGFA